MSILGFTGAAGTGKTTRLMTALESRLVDQPLGDGQRVLALTRMHGSRHRLIDRLERTVARRAFDCLTFDRFAWEVASRWRTRLHEAAGVSPAPQDYDATCDSAALLLADGCVAKWVSARYPVILVDELQDCRGGRLGIVRALGSRADLLVAADEFQDLESTGPSEAVQWLREAGEVEDLATARRTSDAGLLAAATAIRDGRPPTEGKNFRVFRAPHANVAASFLARGITWSAGQEVVVLSATRPETSKFVRETLDRLASKAFKKDGRTFGPFSVPWEQAREGLASQLCERLSLLEGAGAEVRRPVFAAGPTLPAQAELEQWIATQQRLRGDVPIRSSELRLQVERSVQHLRSRPRQGHGLRAMTIHQAKNREFERVLVLWPVEVRGDVGMQRRLIYNAVTRAKRHATLIVQDPNPTKSRLSAAPFR